MQLTRRDVLKGAAAAGALASLAAGETDPAHGFKLGIITDEISSDLEPALDFIAGYKLHWCELRDVWGRGRMWCCRRTVRWWTTRRSLRW